LEYLLVFFLLLVVQYLIFLPYDQAKKAAKNRDEFGKGAVDGIIAPEAANNATAGGAPYHDDGIRYTW
jgi:hypothetical protein